MKFSESIEKTYTDGELYELCKEFNCKPDELEPYMAIKAYHDFKSPTAAFDADTVLADVMSECDYEVNDLAEEVFGIWKNASDKASVEAMFYSLAGVEFRDYLDRVIRETPAAFEDEN